MDDLLLSYKIFLSKQADKFLNNQKVDVKEKINSVLLKLSNNPFPITEYEVKKIQGLINTFRIRLGDIRIVYEILKDEREINILKIEFCGSVYKNI